MEQLKVPLWCLLLTIIFSTYIFLYFIYLLLSRSIQNGAITYRQGQGSQIRYTPSHWLTSIDFNDYKKPHFVVFFFFYFHIVRIVQSSRDHLNTINDEYTGLHAIVDKYYDTGLWPFVLYNVYTTYTHCAIRSEFWDNGQPVITTYGYCGSDRRFIYLLVEKRGNKKVNSGCVKFHPYSCFN